MGVHKTHCCDSCRRAPAHHVFCHGEKDICHMIPVKWIRTPSEKTPIQDKERPVAVGQPNVEPEGVDERLSSDTTSSTAVSWQESSEASTRLPSDSETESGL